MESPGGIEGKLKALEDCVVGVEMVGQLKRNILRCFGHPKRSETGKMVKRCIE